MRNATCFAAILAVSIRAAAQAPSPLGPEFQVNTYTTSYQVFPSVAMDADGDFVVVWQSAGSPGDDASEESIQGQRFGSDGAPAGAQFQVNTHATGYQVEPVVAADSGGDFFVAWTSEGSPEDDVASPSVQGRRFASDGSPLGAQFQINTYTTSYQIYPAVAAEPDGGFVVVWASDGSLDDDQSHFSIQGRRFASDGSSGDEFQINAYTTGEQFNPAVAARADGDFVVLWMSDGSPGDDASAKSVQGQRFGSDGSPVGTQFQVNAHTTGSQERPAVASAPDGGFVAVWSSESSPGSDASLSSIQGRRFASDGSPGDQFQVNTHTPNDQVHPTVAGDAGGGFVVAWHSDGSPGDDASYTSVQGRRLGSDGAAVGEQFQVNTYTPGYQTFASVAAGSEFVVAWASYGSFGTDTFYHSVQARRFAVPEPSFATSYVFAGSAVALIARWRRALRASVRRSA